MAIDLRVVDAPGMEMTGAGRYTLEVTRALQRARPAWRYTLFSNRPELIDGGERTVVVRSRLPTHRAIARVAWLHSAAAISAARLRPDVWFSPAFVLPLWWRGPALVTIHDLTFMLLRERYRGRLNASYATAATRLSAHRADRVLCGSQATRSALVAHLGVEPDKVAVIPYGVSDVFFRVGATVPERDGHGGAPYLLFVGTWEARKGLGTLSTALGRLNAGVGPVRLVLAGQPGWGTDDLLRDLRGNPDVELRERPSDEQLGELYANALALVYPSEMEGFGLPVAEAMACGCPVIATELPSVREFAGDAAIYIAQGDADALAAHAEELLRPGPDLVRRIEHGRERAASLRWSTVGEKTGEMIEALPRQGR